MNHIAITLSAATLALAITPTPPAVAKTSCKGAPSARVICADADVAALARETDRLGALALKAPALTKEGRAMYAERHKEWRAERDACGAAKDCLIEQHLARILSLRQGLASDAKGVSRGPTQYVCDGLAESMSAIFTTTKTPRAYLLWGDYAYALVGEGGEGRYVAELDAGPMRFTRTPAGATLALPGRAESLCRPAV